MPLNYKVYGTGQPLMILHGLFGSLDNWHSIAKQLSDIYQVFIIDLRNHGKSPHIGSMSYASMAGDIAQFMDQMELNTANITGHSMGGKVAMELALEEPSRIEKLISVDMTPFEVSGGHEQIIKALKAFDPSQIQKRSEADKLMQIHIEDFNIRQFLLKNLERRKEGGYQWKMNLSVIEQDYREILKGLSGGNRQFNRPTLFMKGDESNYLLANQLTEYQKLFPKADLVTIPDTGHWIHAQSPNAFLKNVREFLNS